MSKAIVRKTLITVVCDNCGSVCSYPMVSDMYLYYKHNGKDLCYQCAAKGFGKMNGGAEE